MRKEIKQLIYLTTFSVLLLCVAVSCSISMTAIRGDNNEVENDIYSRSDARLKADSLRLIDARKEKNDFKMPKRYK